MISSADIFKMSLIITARILNSFFMRLIKGVPDEQIEHSSDWFR